MADVSNKLNDIEQNIMSGLKDFQKATVNRIDYLFRNGQRRVLVSDEVGLGKTLIARGTVAKLAVMQKETGDNLVKVVYICSNAAIAEQNLNKLRITSELRTESMNSSRLSMQHLNIFNQENDSDLLSRYIQLIPLTPDTSFRITAGAGTVSERALMFAILRRIPVLQDYLSELEIAMIDWAKSAWIAERDWYEKEVLECDENSDNQYLKYMLEKSEAALTETQPNGKRYLDAVIELCLAIRENGMKRVNNNAAIGKLRVMFSKISLDKLEPDLVIMDEFQRFKYLINSDPESETGMLANKFFNSNNVRMLLLSATPYKMYSTLEEIDDSQVDEHYSEFLDVMNFLNIGQGEQDTFKTVWNEYSVKLKELTVGDTTVLAAKAAAENAMYSKVCRTERISATENADIIDDNSVKTPVEVLEQDIKSYISAQKLLDEIGASFHVPVDYIKSTPYLMSFMRDYQLKRYIENYFKKNPDETAKVNKEGLWLNRTKIDNYDNIPSGNARLEVLKQHALANNAELLLWVPPSKPYYEAGTKSPYKNIKHFSKVLVFSAWEMVPRMIASMISYEVERKTVGKLAKNTAEKDVHYFYSGEKRFPLARMNFSVSNDQPNAMTLFCLLYPSEFLTDCYNPIECLNNNLSLKEIEKTIKEKIATALQSFESKTSGQPDKRWYYLAPMLLDSEEYVLEWLGHGEARSTIEDDEEKNKRQSGFNAHLKLLKELYTQFAESTEGLGKMPDDIAEVLTDLAIASPAVCINRTYRRYNYGFGFDSSLPSQIAKIFINRMNTPESTAVIELCYGKSEDAHWMNLLSYSKDGNIQAMFDEYAHVISNGIDKDENAVKRLHYAIADSMSIRTTPYGIDTRNAFITRARGGKARPVNIRTHFAVAFTKGDGSSDKATDRKKIVRNAFNSPFRPFVLASTSIGQEGLDFHNYCRKIVHWNLPSNPIDLEQREGRINRFECLAIRQNIAERYGDAEFNNDIWAEMFDNAVKDTKAHNQHSSDLIPFWGLPETEDMVKIERIVPMYPFSKDCTAYERMIKILSLYRLTLGQARQEELLEYIFQNCEAGEDFKGLFINLSPHYKEKKQGD